MLLISPQHLRIVNLRGEAQAGECTLPLSLFVKQNKMSSSACADQFDLIRCVGEEDGGSFGSRGAIS